MALRDRLTALEGRISASHSVHVVIVLGGLPEPTSATINGFDHRPLADETFAAFKVRVVKLAEQAGQPNLVISGLKADGSIIIDALPALPGE